MTDWVTAAKVEDLPEGEMVGATVDGVDVLVANLGGRYRAIGSECTHEGCDLHEGDLDAEEGVVTCACHGSMFDVETGEVVAPPAEEPEPVYQVRVEGGEIQVAPARDVATRLGGARLALIRSSTSASERLCWPRPGAPRAPLVGPDGTRPAGGHARGAEACDPRRYSVCYGRN